VDLSDDRASSARGHGRVVVSAGRYRNCLAAASVLLAVGCSGSATGSRATAPPSAAGGTGAAPPNARGASPVDSASFAPGACISYPPTKGNRATTVFLDAGHGGLDPGASGRTTDGRVLTEKDITLAVVLDTTSKLQAAGFTVVVSRNTDTTVAKLRAGDANGKLLTVAGVHADVEARARCANQARAAVLLSVHFNSGLSPRYGGAMSVYDAARPFSAENQRFAGLLQASVLGQLNAHGWNIPNAGVVTDNGVGTALSSAAAAYGHLLILGPAKAGYFESPTTMPGALVEPLFLTDPFEADVAAGQPGQQSIATGLATAITQQLTHG
jgi:N-acetylmuramoyl-L-alanine amidase